MSKYKNFDIELAKEKDYDEIEQIYVSENHNYNKDEFKLYPAFVAKKDGKVVAFYTSYLGKSDEHEIVSQLSDKNKLNFGIIEDCFVLREYRGNGLQAVLGRKLIDYIFEQNENIDKIYTEEDPRNIASLRSLKKMGFGGFDRNHLSGPQERFILVARRYF